MTQIKFRRGSCESCGAMYKLPDSFAADKARCKECGGVVAVGPVEIKADTPRPGKQAAARPVPAKPARQAATRPVKKTAQKAAPRASGSAGSATRTKQTTAKKSEESSSRRRGSSSSSKRRGSSSSRSRGRSREAERAEKKSPLPLLLGALGLAGLGAGGWWFMNKENTTQAAETDKPAEVLVNDATENLGEVAPAEVIDDADPAEDAENDKQADAEPEPEKEEAPPERIDLSTWEDWPRFEGTSDEEWEQLLAWMADFGDPYAPARKFSAARDGLIAGSRNAMPAILNKFKTLDVSLEEERKMGDQIQRELLQKICDGRNYDWRYDEEPKSVRFNEKVIELWMKAWSQAVESDLAWSNLSKIPLDQVQGKTTSKEDSEVLDSLDDF